MEMIYAPRSGFFGLVQREPVKVDVIELRPDEGYSRVKMPLGENCLVNVLRTADGREPLEWIETEVPTADLKPIQ